MGKLTKRELEAEVAKLEARVAEQSAVIARLMMSPQAWPVYLPTPCLRPHADEVRLLPYVWPTWQPVAPPLLPEIICGGETWIEPGMVFKVDATLAAGNGCAGAIPTFGPMGTTIDFGAVPNLANACCAAPMFVGTVWVGTGGAGFAPGHAVS